MKIKFNLFHIIFKFRRIVFNVCSSIMQINFTGKKYCYSLHPYIHLVELVNNTFFRFAK